MGCSYSSSLLKTVDRIAAMALLVDPARSTPNKAQKRFRFLVLAYVTSFATKDATAAWSLDAATILSGVWPSNKLNASLCAMDRLVDDCLRKFLSPPESSTPNDAPTYHAIHVDRLLDGMAVELSRSTADLLRNYSQEDPSFGVFATTCLQVVDRLTENGLPEGIEQIVQESVKQYRKDYHCRPKEDAFGMVDRPADTE